MGVNPAGWEIRRLRLVDNGFASEKTLISFYNPTIINETLNNETLYPGFTVRNRRGWQCRSESWWRMPPWRIPCAAQAWWLLPAL